MNGAPSDDTGKLQDGADLTHKSLKYLCDLAGVEVINRFTTAEGKG